GERAEGDHRSGRAGPPHRQRIQYPAPAGRGHSDHHGRGARRSREPRIGEREVCGRVKPGANRQSRGTVRRGYRTGHLVQRRQLHGSGQRLPQLRLGLWRWNDWDRGDAEPQLQDARELHGRFDRLRRPGRPATGRDTSGNTATAEASVTITALPDAESPVITLNAPPQAAPGTTVHLSAAATDNVGVKSVAFAVDGVEIVRVTTPPYEAT